MFWSLEKSNHAPISETDFKLCVWSVGFWIFSWYHSILSKAKPTNNSTMYELRHPVLKYSHLYRINLDWLNNARESFISLNVSRNWEHLSIAKCTTVSVYIQIGTSGVCMHTYIAILSWNVTFHWVKDEGGGGKNTSYDNIKNPHANCLVCSPFSKTSECTVRTSTNHKATRESNTCSKSEGNIIGPMLPSEPKNNQNANMINYFLWEKKS